MKQEEPLGQATNSPGSPNPAPVLSPTNKTATVEKIRPELNLEKWPIWQPSKSKNPPKARIAEREITLAGGNKLTATVEIGFTQRGELTTEDQRTYYALVKQWEETGRPDHYTFFSLRHLSRSLHKKWGTNVITALTESLIRLRTTPFIWKNSYHDAATKETIRILDTFNILSDLRIVRREQDGVVNKEVGYFKFNDFTLKNLMANHTKPVLLDTVLGFRSEIAQMLYTHIDLILADKTHFERRSLELFSDLGLRGKAYRNPSNRKQLLIPALKELEGAFLTTGMISSATLERTKDDKDYKVVFKKSRRLLPIRVSLEEKQGSRAMEQSLEAVPAPEFRNDSFNEEAKELVAYFYSLFQPEVQKIYFNSKAIDQAISLIASLGNERARFVVEFSAKVAPQTNYSPQTFGGILQYTSRAMAQVDEAEQIRVKQELIASCPFCSESGYRRIGNNTMRECTHDPKLEAALPDGNSIGTFQTMTSPEAQNGPSMPDTLQNENRPAESSASL
jgi:hypothetical protein